MDIEKIYSQIKKNIKNFGKSPIEDVGKILTFVQSFEEVRETEVMLLVQKVYLRLYQEIKKGDLNQARQSWVNASGNNFEGFIREFINKELNDVGIVAIKGDELKHLIPKNKNLKGLVEFITLPARRRCIQENTGVWPDSDILMLTKNKDNQWKVFALLNCKTSDHSRNTAVMFWALALRDLGIKYALMTQDLDNRFTKGHESPSTLRRLSEAYLDAVFSTNPRTIGCSQIKRLDFTNLEGAKTLTDTLKAWRESVVTDHLNNYLDKSSLT